MKVTLFVLFISSLFFCSRAIEFREFEFDVLCKNLETRPNLFLPAVCMNEERMNNIRNIGRNFATSKVSQNLNPVFLLPGLAASVLETKSSNSDAPSWCTKSYDWRHSWVNIPSFLPHQIDCLFHTLKISYDKQNHQFHNQKGITLRPKDFGGVHGIDYLDDGLLGSPPLFGYYAPVIEGLEAAGYQVGKNIFGIPYDWRQYSNQHAFYDSMRELFEKAYAMNGNKSSHIIAHSMGNLHTNAFLSTVSQQWKDKYIASFFAVSAPWSGASMALRTLVSGNDLVETITGIPFIDPHKIRELVRETGSVAWLLPDSDYYNQKTLVVSPRREYTGRDLKDLLRDANSSLSWDIHTRGAKLSEMRAPGVKIHCVISLGVSTEESYVYESTLDKKPLIKTSDGDGIVPLASLRDCYKWAGKQTKPVHKLELVGPHHNLILSTSEFMKYLLENIK